MAARPPSVNPTWIALGRDPLFGGPNLPVGFAPSLDALRAYAGMRACTAAVRLGQGGQALLHGDARLGAD